MKISAIIPARFASTRFPGKALAMIYGKPMIQHVYERTMLSRLVSDVIVATDDERIASVVRTFGGNVTLTSSEHETGTDRLAEVAAKLEPGIIVNVQGDEPLIDSATIDAAIKPLIADATLQMSTLKVRIVTLESYLSPNVVKVVTDCEGNALYFSRSPIPLCRDCGETLSDADLASGRLISYKHVGLYVYRSDYLKVFTLLPPSPLEQFEKLEQLRALENGCRIRVVETAHDSIGVDVPADLEKVLKLLNG